MGVEGGVGCMCAILELWMKVARSKIVGGWLVLVLLALGLVSTALAGELPAVPEVPEEAREVDAFDQGEPRVENRLLVDAEQVRPGDTVAVGMLFDMDPGWHIYWRSAGQGGMSTEAAFEADQGYAGPTQWPEPTVYHEAGGQIITFGYGGKALLFAEITVGDDAEGELEIRGDVDYLVCEVDCIPGDAQLVRTIEIGDERVDADEATSAWFDYSRRALPMTPQETGVDVTVRYSHAPIEQSERFRVEISAVGCWDDDDEDCVELGEVPQRAADAFVYDSVPTISFDVVRVSPHPEAKSGWFVELDGRASRDSFDGDARLTGVLRLRGADGQFLATIVDELLPRTDSEEAQALVAGEESLGEELPAESSEAPSPTEVPESLLYFLLLAFIGGALLNLMPCVFPVLAIKVFAFINLVHEERGHIYSHSAAYTGGIVASMLVLAAAVIGLQVLGTHVGWGFQFQEPRFIAVVGAVLVIFALNLFGVFEVTLNPGRLQEVTEAPVTHRRSFGEGVLAVVLATPCSAPFLGTAVGFALASPPWVILATFTVLGMGLAAPFVVLTLVPGAAKFLPRPGAWMNHFKQLLGFALLGTVIWLVWLIAQMEGAGGVTALLSFLLACALGVWVVGLVQFKSGWPRRVGIFSAAAIVAIVGFFTLQFDGPTRTNGQGEEVSADGPIAWKTWSDEAVQAELAEGRPVFVDFTADWCITCKVNEANVLEDQRVLDAIAEYDVAMFMADWTRRDEVIRQKLAEFGKAGVPLYLMYAPSDPDEPEVLPELLTRQMVVDAMGAAAP